MDIWNPEIIHRGKNVFNPLIYQIIGFLFLQRKKQSENKADFGIFMDLKDVF